MTRLEEIRKRYEAATPGPWEVKGYRPYDTEGPNAPPILRAGPVDVRNDNMKADADFIGHSREDIPWLMEMVEKQERALKKQWQYLTHLPECWKVRSFVELGVGGPLASCTCGLDDIKALLE